VRARIALLVVTFAGLRAASAASGPDEEWRKEWKASEAERGPIAKRTLEHDERVGRVPCKASFDVGVDAKGRLAFCTTATAVTLDGLPVAADTYASFYPSGRVYQAQLAAAAHEFMLADGRKISCARSYIGLHADGRLLHCDLAAPLTMAPGVRVSGGGVVFWNDGHVRWGAIDQPLRVGPGTLPAGSVLRWDRSGAVVGGTVKLPLIDFGGLRITGAFELHANGRLKQATLGAPARVAGNDLPAWAELSLRADGTLERTRYLKASGFVQHQEWTDTTQIEYDRSGKPTSTRVEHTGPKAP